MPVNKPKKPRPTKVAPAKVNNYLKNKPMMAKSKNIYPAYRKPRDVEEIKPVVNGKVADENLIHKPILANPEPFFPVIQKGKSDSPSKKNVKRDGKKSKE